MKKVIIAGEELFSEDKFLAVQHALDTAMQEADKASKSFRSHGAHMPEHMMLDVAETCYDLQRRIREVKTVYYGDTVQTMLEDQSRYLED